MVKGFKNMLVLGVPLGLLLLLLMSMAVFFFVADGEWMDLIFYWSRLSTVTIGTLVLAIVLSGTLLGATIAALVHFKGGKRR